jgi:hypothetical protein
LTSAARHDEETGVLPLADQSLGVLLLLGDATPMGPLLEVLRQQGLRVDAVDDLEGARSSFFGAGGHDCLVVSPDVSPGLAQSVAAALTEVDPGVAIATFGPQVRGSKASRTARLCAFHPGSRAGQGALLRFLRSL